MSIFDYLYANHASLTLCHFIFTFNFDHGALPRQTDLLQDLKGEMNVLAEQWL